MMLSMSTSQPLGPFWDHFGQALYVFSGLSNSQTKMTLLIVATAVPDQKNMPVSIATSSNSAHTVPYFHARHGSAIDNLLDSVGISCLSFAEIYAPGRTTLNAALAQNVSNDSHF
jgi:hypothetical protein